LKQPIPDTTSLDKSDFGLIVIGDEILFGSRHDRHYEHFRALLANRGLRLIRAWVLPDDPPTLTGHLRFSMQTALPVFVCGGIGATPDDHTRACAAAAADRALARHAEAAALIEARFGEAAHPTRIRMADLPSGCTLVPNPFNGIPGFSLDRHYFLPGFPEMAWPMAEWVLDRFYGGQTGRIEECFLRVSRVPESRLVTLMEGLTGRFEGLKCFSLPHLGATSYVDIGFRGRGDLGQAMTMLRELLAMESIAFEEVTGTEGPPGGLRENGLT